MIGNLARNIFLSSLDSLWSAQQIRCATKKAGGTVRNGRDSIGKRLGLKKSGGQRVIAGNIIIRQRGLSYASGSNTGLGRDYTIWALTPGYVKFTWDPKKKRNIVSVEAEYPYGPAKVPVASIDSKLEQAPA
jgi:large subunit ribosomal protein L27